MNFPEIDKRIINFWRSAEIFEKSLRKNFGKKRFNWIEGPPYANDKPHMGHFLTRIYKDSILRFFSMLGFYVPRRAGWDTHGLPIEVATEKTLGFKDKKEILDYGIDKFNKKCKELVMKYKNIWELVDERMGFWIDHKNAYITYDPFYMESCWWIIKEIYKKGLLKQEHRVVPYCPRCETVLAQAELGMPDAYKKVKDPSIYVKFKIQDSRSKIQEGYFLVWTTTPWTLPGNLALAVHPDFDYFVYETEQGRIITRQKLDKTQTTADKTQTTTDKTRTVTSNTQIKLISILKGKDLIGLQYEPLFKIPNANFQISTSNIYKVYPADFVKEDEGTGIVHIAPAYGEEDFELGRKYDLGIINYLDEKGRFVIDLEWTRTYVNSKEPRTYANLKTKDLFFKEADKLIIENLKERNLLFKEEIYEHDYPHCWRCKTPLIYYATKFWVIKVSEIKNQVLENNSKVNWLPKTAGNRFYEWIKEGKDWNLSRTRFWGIPLPIWQCNKCQKTEFIGSLKELASHFKPNNNYYLMRHCSALSLNKNFLSSYPEQIFNPLTRKGVGDAKQKAKSLKGKIDIIYTSPILRAKETAMIIGDEIKVPVYVDERLREVDMGVLQGKPYEEFDRYIVDKMTGKRDLKKKIENGESLDDVRQRAIRFILELEKIHRDKNILIVSHGGVLWMLESEMKALSSEEIRNFKVKNYKLGEIRKVDLLVVPRDENGEINTHRPYVDSFVWQCSCGSWMKRISEIADIWFDSGSASFSAYHYPFENKREIDSWQIFPQDFIIEGIDQTRGWFYTLLIIATLIKNSPAYKNVLATGLVLDKKGIKMSKSLGNVVDPMEIMDKYGADPLRFYLFYLNEVGENKSFNEEELLKLRNEFFDLLFNILRFYKFYYVKDKNLKNKKIIPQTLDLWFSARLKEAYQEYYQAMTNYNLHKASRILTHLLGDFSRWWLRRSRERFQNPKNKDELISALINFENFFFEYLKMLAPLAPFTTEYLYQEIKDELRKRLLIQESIHLENLSKPSKLTAQERILLLEMEKARKIASEIHKLRKEKNIKVRQPLRLLILKTRLSPEILEILKDEVNVLEIKINPKQSEEIFLDLQIDEQLKEIGILNDFIRFVQDLRQESGLTPKEIVGLKIEAGKILENVLNKELKFLLQRTKTEIRKKKKVKIAEKEFNYENFGKVKIILFK